MLNAKLVVIGGDAKTHEVKLKLPTVVGRGKEAGLTVPHALVSRRHTEIFERDGRLVVRDLGSLNGTFVDNRKIDGEQVLEPNQLLTIGNITFRAVYEVTETIQRDPDTVSFEMAATVEEPRPSNEISDIVSFSDDSLSDSDLFSENDAKASERPKPAPAVIKSEASKPETPEVDQLKKPAAIADKLPDLESDIFQLDDQAPKPAVSMTGLENLATEGNAGSEKSEIDPNSIDLGELSPPSRPNVTSINIDLGDEKPATQDVDSGLLDSFMKKLPR